MRSSGRRVLPALLVAAGLLPGAMPACAARGSASTPFERAQRQREALEGRSEQQRTRRDYERVLDAYRQIYHADPRSSKADASINAVAELLAEEGRLFNEARLFHDAIGQYEFLRREYPGTRYRFGALLTEGEIYRRDLGDRDAAKETFQQFLKQYPRNSLAEQARQELAEMRAEEHPPKREKSPKTQASAAGSRRRAAASAAQAPGAPSGRANPLAGGTSQAADQAADRASAPPAPAAVKAMPAAANPRPTPAPPAAGVIAAATQTAPASGADPLNLPTPRRGRMPMVTGIRHWSTPVYTRVAIDLQGDVEYEASRVPNPDRIFFDLHGARLAPELIGRAVDVTDGGFLKRVRAAQFSNDVTRIVLDVSDVSEYSAFLLPNPTRLIIDVHGTRSGKPAMQVASAPATSAPVVPAAHPAEQAANNAHPVQPTRPRSSTLRENDLPAAANAAPIAPAPGNAVVKGNVPAPVQRGILGQAVTPTYSSTNRNVGATVSAPHTTGNSGLEEIANLDSQPNRVRATRRPTNQPIVASVEGTSPAPQPNDMIASNNAPPMRRSRGSNSTVVSSDAAGPIIHEATPTSGGQRSLVRALGLKIGRIVVDAGHGGHDSGTLGPQGIQEKDVVLDVALRLGKLLKQRLGADVIYTRDDDTFIPLETRTAIANKAQADLFISVHANSSSDESARGVETYYLNFTSSPDALEVAARENAVSNQSIHQLSDLVKKIALTEKINESREFASNVQGGLYSGLEKGNPGLKDRGVKKAPFVVLIGANMPSILAEISFLTNPDDAEELRDSEYRQRIAESLYRGVAKYVGGLSGVRLAEIPGR